ncbi:MAG: HAD family hydrolase [Caldilineaceae bacterium]|nr:HAD family hydrolase [Caldilineaceae bacterium]
MRMRQVLAYASALWPTLENFYTKRTMITAILFDLDGTLVHHDDALIPGLLAEWGYIRDYAAVKEAVAHSIYHFYNHIRQAEEQDWVEELFRDFYHLTLKNLDVPDADMSYATAMREYFHAAPLTPLFDDVAPVLEQLHEADYRMGVITQRGRAGAEHYLRRHGIHRHFDVLVAGDDGNGRKPTAAPFHYALAQLGVPGESAVYIGDRIDDDCEGAREAGLSNAFLIDRDNVFAVEAAARRDFVHLTDLRELFEHL